MTTMPRSPVPDFNAIPPRRRFLRTAFWTGAGLSVLGSGLVLARFCQTNPTSPRDFVRVPGSELPQLGAPPLYVPEAKAYLVNLRPGEGGVGTQQGNRLGGLVALQQKCTHLGCRLPWRPDFVFEGSAGGWFRCPCHSATYTKAGVCVFGPAPRNMDTLDVVPQRDGVLLRKTPIHRGALRP